jgi:hypothetical protein
MKAALVRWRKAKAELAQHKTFENAVELQAAERNLRAARRKALKLIPGGKT